MTLYVLDGYVSMTLFTLLMLLFVEHMNVLQVSSVGSEWEAGLILRPRPP